MTSVDQNAVFRDGEGDSWFRRNRAALEAEGRADPASDMAARLLSDHPGIERVCELGCANGWRLARLRAQFPQIKQAAGCDISSEAIAAGRAQDATLDLRVAAIDQPPFEQAFDLVIVNFVLHWVARDALARSIAAIDASVRDGGWLVLADFLPDAPCARRYGHRDDVELFTYKQDYRACFEALGFYRVVESDIHSHGQHCGPIDPQDRSFCALLEKSFALYAQA